MQCCRGPCFTHLSPYTTPLHNWRSLFFSLLCNDAGSLLPLVQELRVLHGVYYYYYCHSYSFFYCSAIGTGVEGAAWRFLIIIIIILIIVLIVLPLVQELRVLHGLCSALLERVQQADL